MALMSASGLLNNVLSIVSGLFVAKWLLPENLGLFNSFNIITSYVILIQLGIPSGLSREYPFYLGKNDPEKAKLLASISNYWSIFLSVAVFILSIIGSVYFIFLRNYEFAAGVFVIGVSSFQGFYVSKYLKILFRSTNDFNKLSYINLITGIASFITILFVYYWGFYGLCLRTVIVCLIDFLITWYYKPLNVKPFWNKEIFRELFKVGMPIYMVANIYSLWPIIQRSFVLGWGGTKALGLYGLALMVENAMMVITSSVSNITFPKMAMEWGKSKDLGKLISIMLKPTLGTFALNLFAVLIGWFVLPIFVNGLIPNYSEGIYVAQLSLIVGLFAVFSVYSNLYMIIQRNTDRMFTYLVGFLVWVIALFILQNTQGFQLHNFPIALCLAYIGIYGADFFFYLRYKKIFA